MNEHELKDALRGVMVAGSPPPMDGTAALDAARGALRRRRATIAASGSALAIVVIAVAALIVAGPVGTPGGQVGGSGAPPATDSSDTKTVWPTGPDGQPQQDRTATAGPRADQAVKLESELISVLPQGLTPLPEQPPSPPTGPGDLGGPVRMHQSQFVDRVDGMEVWEYFSLLPVTTGAGKAGLAFAMVYTPGNELPDDLCAAAKTLWGAHGPDGPIDLGWVCQEMTVGALKVGVVSAHQGDSPEFEQWAFYRHPDGTAVFVAQARQGRGGLPALDAQPFTLRELAALASNQKFHLS